MSCNTVVDGMPVKQGCEKMNIRESRKTTICDAQQKGPSAVVEREMQLSNVKCSGLKNNSKMHANSSAP